MAGTSFFAAADLVAVTFGEPADLAAEAEATAAVAGRLMPGDLGDDAPEEDDEEDDDEEEEEDDEEAE